MIKNSIVRNLFFIQMKLLLLKIKKKYSHNFYQTEHFFVGFILDPSGQLKSFVNSGILDNVPITRNLDGGCASIR